MTALEQMYFSKLGTFIAKWSTIAVIEFKDGVSVLVKVVKHQMTQYCGITLLVYKLSQVIRKGLSFILCFHCHASLQCHSSLGPWLSPHPSPWTPERPWAAAKAVLCVRCHRGLNEKPDCVSSSLIPCDKEQRGEGILITWPRRCN